MHTYSYLRRERFLRKGHEDKTIFTWVGDQDGSVTCVDSTLLSAQGACPPPSSAHSTGPTPFLYMSELEQPESDGPSERKPELNKVKEGRGIAAQGKGMRSRRKSVPAICSLFWRSLKALSSRRLLFELVGVQLFHLGTHYHRLSACKRCWRLI